MKFIKVFFSTCILVWGISSIALETIITHQPSETHRTFSTASWTPNVLNSYVIKVIKWGWEPWHFNPNTTEISTGGILTDSGSSMVRGVFPITHNEYPNTTNFSLSINGTWVTPEGSGGPPPTWSVTLEADFFWLTPFKQIVAAGTDAKVTTNGTPTEINWLINGNYWTDSNNNPKKASSITLGSSLWTDMGWNPSPVPTGFNPPTAGVYTITAVNGSVIGSATVTVVDVIKIQYSSSASGPWSDFADYDGDGDGEYIIQYYDTIITKKSELNGGTKNKIKIYFRAIIDPALTNWPTDKPSWSEGLTVTSDRTVAYKEFEDKGSTTIIASFDATCQKSVKVHVIKVDFEDDSTPCGFDEADKDHYHLATPSSPEGTATTYKTAISLNKTGIAKFEVTIDPKPAGLAFHLSSHSSNIVKFGTSSTIALTSATSAVTINGQNNVGGTYLSAYIQDSSDPNLKVSFAAVDSQLKVQAYTNKDRSLVFVKIHNAGTFQFDTSPFKEAVTYFPQPAEYTRGNASDVPGDGQWFNWQLSLLKTNFPYPDHDHVVYILPGTFFSAPTTLGLGDPGGKHSWIFLGAAHHDSVIAHELGHNLKLADEYYTSPPYDSGPDPSNVMNNLTGKQLWYTQWDTVNLLNP